jgi:hypothetical protein
MSRLQFEKGAQAKFLSDVKAKSVLKWSEIAYRCSICSRTLRDWRNEKLKITHEAALAISDLSGISIPEPFVILSEHWHTKKAGAKGAKIRYEMYGNPGTAEGRIKGGRRSQARFKQDPEFAKRSGVIIRKDIKLPSESELLAEFIGILLGDGGITDYQVKITYNKITDKEYSYFIHRTVSELFGISAATSTSDKDLGENVVISGRNLVEYLVSMGMLIGDKIGNRIDIPRWILKSDEYTKACIRGLVDTDGSFYSYKHKVNSKEYLNFSMCFTNHCKPLLNSFYGALTALGFRPTSSPTHVYLHKRVDIDKYFAIINTHNPKHRGKYEDYLKCKSAI